DFYNHPRVQPFVKGLRTNKAHAYFLGICTNHRTPKPDLMTALIIDASQFSTDDLSFTPSWETDIVYEARLENIDKWINDSRMASASATCLSLARKHLPYLLSVIR